MIGFVGLGSNLGDRRCALERAVDGLSDAGLRPIRLSSIWESEPVDAPAGSGWFLNMVARVETSLGPERALQRMHEVEDRLGRRRSGPRNAPRRLDLDLLLLGEQRRAGRVVLPHPRMWQRRFVLEPLAEVAPGLRNPDSGRSVLEELARLPNRERTFRIGRLARRESGPV